MAPEGEAADYIATVQIGSDSKGQVCFMHLCMTFCVSKEMQILNAYINMYFYTDQ